MYWSLRVRLYYFENIGIGTVSLRDLFVVVWYLHWEFAGSVAWEIIVDIIAYINIIVIFIVILNIIIDPVRHNDRLTIANKLLRRASYPDLTYLHLRTHLLVGDLLNFRLPSEGLMHKLPIFLIP